MIEQKIRKESSISAQHWECLTKEEREIYADYLAENGQHRSAILFTLDEAKKEKFKQDMRWKHIY